MLTEANKMYAASSDRVEQLLTGVAICRTTQELMMRLLSDRGSSETMDDNVVVDESFPTELQERLTDFDDALTQVEEVLKPLHSVPLSDIHTKVCVQQQ